VTDKCIIGIQTFGGFRAALQTAACQRVGLLSIRRGDMMLAIAPPVMPAHALRASL
jgi:hypothetical protein